MSDLTAQIASELYRAIKHLGGSGQLLSIVGSYGDTLDDDDVLRLLRAWNKGHEASLVPADKTR